MNASDKKEAANNHRRLKVGYLGHAWLMRAMRYVTHDVVGYPLPKIKSPFPEDAEVVAVEYDISRLAFAVVFRHDSFDVVPDCCEIPSVVRPVCEVEWVTFTKQPDGSYRLDIT